MKANVLLVAAFLACALGATFAVADSNSSSSGPTINEVFIHCAPNANQQVDPIRAYGQPMSAHLHTPGGAEDFSDSTTVGDMISPTTATSCGLQSDHTLFWFPTPMTSAGVPATIQNQSYYLTNQPPLSLDPSNPTPNGLRFVAGNSACASTTCDSNVEYQCAGSTVTKHVIPTSCPAGTGYLETVYAINQCWDGGPGLSGSLGEGMGDPTGPNVIGTDLVSGTSGFCPVTPTPSGGSWQVIPGIVWTAHVGQDGVGGFVSSDVPLGTQTSCSGCSNHLDFVFGESPAALAHIDTDCLNVAGLPPGVQQGCVEKPNGDGTASLYALDSTGHYTVFVTR
jgi:hypothetical protein